MFVSGQYSMGGSLVSLMNEYTSITIVQSYAGKYQKFVAVCIVTSAQHK